VSSQTDPFAALQLVVNQLVGIVGKKRGIQLGKEVIVSDDETNDLHVSVQTVWVHPVFVTRGDPVEMMEHIFDEVSRYNEEREVRTKHAIQDLERKLRLSFRQMAELDPERLDTIVEEEFYMLQENTLLLEADRLPGEET
jgi:hypothetical protein